MVFGESLYSENHLLSILRMGKPKARAPSTYQRLNGAHSTSMGEHVCLGVHRAAAVEMHPSPVPGAVAAKASSLNKDSDNLHQTKLSEV